MKDNGYHTEVKQKIRQQNKQKRHSRMRLVAKSDDERTPVDALGASRVAAEYLDLRKQIVNR